MTSDDDRFIWLDSPKAKLITKKGMFKITKKVETAQNYTSYNTFQNFSIDQGGTNTQCIRGSERPGRGVSWPPPKNLQLRSETAYGALMLFLCRVLTSAMCCNIANNQLTNTFSFFTLLAEPAIRNKPCNEQTIRARRIKTNVTVVYLSKFLKGKTLWINSTQYEAPHHTHCAWSHVFEK